MSITVLGCDGSYAGPGGACSGYLVSSGATNVWIDTGPGTMANLQQHIDLGDVTAIVISHSHPDHMAELPVVHNALGYYFDRMGVPLYGTADTRERLLVGKGGPIDVVFDWHTITDKSEFDIDGLRFACAETDHPVETLAMRIENGNGGAIGYTSDTGSAWSISTLGEGLDVLLSEATFPEDQAGEFAHLTASEAGAGARDAGVQRLVLTHLLPRADHELARALASDAFASDAVDIATTHMRIDT
jgi:ribonuclease BN (tRNA processing enzyme)